MGICRGTVVLRINGVIEDSKDYVGRENRNDIIAECKDFYFIDMCLGYATITFDPYIYFQHPVQVISDADRQSIIDKYIPFKYPAKKLAKEYGISATTVFRILNLPNHTALNKH